MKHRALPAVTLVVVCLLAPSAVRAQSKYVRISDIAKDQRESVTLSRHDDEGANCGVTFNSKRPPFASYIEQQKMQAIIDAEKGDAGDKYVLYSVRVMHDGGATTRVIETNMKAEQVKRIDSAINSALVPRNDTADVFFRLRLDPGKADEPLRVGPSVICAPRIQNFARIQRAIVDLAPRKYHPSSEHGPLTATIWLRLDDKGKPIESRVNVSSGDPVFDNEARKSMERFARFYPALYDGKPFGVWVALPVIFRVL